MILAIESSCDESAVALFEPEGGGIREWIHSQIPIHQNHGGVVPDLASREHTRHLPRLLSKVHWRIDNAPIEHVAVTFGPGLASCLAMGIALAKCIALEFQVPLVGVNHLRGHAYSPFIGLYQSEPETFASRLSGYLPHLGLIVSGGNTLLFEIDKNLRLQILAQTVDDAAGEALDKGARLLGLGYPGGPLIEETGKQGDDEAFAFPRAFASSGEPKFSFSGLKTSLRYRMEKVDDDKLNSLLPDLCASYQAAVVEALTVKTEQFLQVGRFRSLGLSGGVANNRRLRDMMEGLASRFGVVFFCAEAHHTGDNASMIAFASRVDETGSVFDPDLALSFNPSLTLDASFDREKS